MTNAEKIYAECVKRSTAIMNGLTQKSQVVFAVLVHVHCLFGTHSLLVPVASRCHFVGSSHGQEKTVVVGDKTISISQTEF